MVVEDEGHNVPTTSVRAPLLDLFARLFLVCDFFCMKSTTAPVPTKAAIPTARAVFRDIHRCKLFQYDAGTSLRGGGGGGRELTCSGSQSLSCVATLSKCFSTPSASSLYCRRAWDASR